MHVDTLRYLDRFVGVTLCWVVTQLRRVLRAAGTRALPVPHKILVIKLSEMGSTVLAYPALDVLKRCCPESELFFLVFEKSAAIVDVLDLCPADHVVTVGYDSPGQLLTSGLRAIRRLLRARIDTTIDMDLFSRLTAVLSFLVCRGNRVGFHRYSDEGLYRGDLLTHRVRCSQHIHTSAAFMALVKTLFADATDEPHFRGSIDLRELSRSLPQYAPMPEEVTALQRRFEATRSEKGADDVLIVVNPNSSSALPLRAWPLDNYAQLCERLLKDMPRCRLVITGLDSDRNDAGHIMERVQSPRCIDLTGKTTFRELLALYSIADVMVTNDSGPAHFASLLRLPTVVLFGPETPQLYEPLGDTHKALYSGFACSPCVSVYNGKKSSCQDNRCLKSISVDTVRLEVIAWLPIRNRARAGIVKTLLDVSRVTPKAQP